MPRGKESGEKSTREGRMSDREALVHDFMNKENFMNKALERGE